MRIFTLGLIFSFLSTPIMALQQPDLQDNDWTFDEFTFDSDEISVRNPRSHGEIVPHLWGQKNSVSLNVEGRRFSWTGMVSERGVLHLWGEGALEWADDENLTVVDQKLRKLVDQNFDVFQVRARELWLSKQRTAFAGPFRTVTYQRRVNMGLSEPVPVERAFVTFRFKWNRLIQITNQSYGKIERIPVPEMTGDDALAAAYEDLRFVAGADKVVSRVRLELQPYYVQTKKVEFRPVYQLSIRKKSPLGLWKYSVSAQDGSIVRVTSGLHTLNVLAEVLPRLPQDEPITVAMPFVNVTAGQEREQADARGEFTLDPKIAFVELAGPFVETRRRQREIPRKRASMEGVHFSAKESLDENMAYFHITHVNQFVQKFIKADFLRKAIVVNTKVSSGNIKSCSAWFDGMDGSLNFLEGDQDCNNTSHIADAIYHEWGHALDNGLGGIQDDVFSEAIGDVTAVLMTGDAKMAPGFFRKDPKRPVRDLSILKIYPRDQHRDPHKEALIVGGAWYETLRILSDKLGSEEGRLKTADLFFRHLVSTDSYLDSYQGMLVIDDDDGDLSNGTPHLCLINPAFAKRGLAAYDERCRGGDGVL